MKPLLRYPAGSPRAMLAAAAALIAVIALIDWRNPVNAYFGFLYVFPMLLVGCLLPYWQIALTAVFCTVLAEIFDPFPFVWATALPQDILLFIALVGMGLFSRQVTVNRLLELESRRKVEEEVAARREAEEQLQFLIQTSPVAILVMSASGEILIANSSAYQLFGVGAGELMGRNISRYVAGPLPRAVSRGDGPDLQDRDAVPRDKGQWRHLPGQRLLFYLQNGFGSPSGRPGGRRLRGPAGSRGIRLRAAYGGIADPRGGRFP